MNFDVVKIRDDFPFLAKHPGLTYFDNACMSLRPKSVIDKIGEYYIDSPACAGRSNHRLAKKVSDEVNSAREKVRKFINANSIDEIVFTRNTSEGLNLLAVGLNLKSDDLVVVSDKEHNSNLVPWLKLKKEVGIRVEVVKSDINNQVVLSSWEKAIANKPKVVSLGMTSNLDGVTNPIKEISRLAHKVNAVVIVDAAQSVPHQKVDVKDLDVDYLAFSVHKMSGPSGMGILYGKKSRLEELKPFMVGGDTVDWTRYDDYEMLPVPERFEAGLQDYAGIMGTAAAIDYLTSIGLQNIHDHEINLNLELSNKLRGMDRIMIIGPNDASERGGISAFQVMGANYHQVALMLDQVGGVMVRSGQHCVHSWFNDRKIEGSVRASLYYYNTMDEVEKFVTTLKQVLEVV